MKKGRLLIIIGIFWSMFLISGCTAEKSNLQIGSKVDYQKDDYKQIKDEHNRLGIDILQLLVANEKDNVVLSPTSLFMALGMLYNGADKETKEEIDKLLHDHQLDVKQVNQANASLMMKLAERVKEEKIQLHLANSIWIKDGLDFQADFTEQVQSYYNAELGIIERKESKAAKEINDWVSNNTNDKIKKMVQPPLHPNLVAMLLNAIYFQGNWKTPFDEEQTADAPFYLMDDTEVMVPMMNRTDEMSYLENDLFQAVKLPYGEVGNISLFIYLPKEDVKAHAWEEDWVLENLQTWQKQFENQIGTLSLPTFQTEYEIILNEALQQLGLKKAFTNQADLSKLIVDKTQLQIDEVKQKTFLSIHEEGTEAAAATSISVIESSAITTKEPFSMEVNRPFYFVLMDETLDIQLFLGKITHPKQATD